MRRYRRIDVFSGSGDSSPQWQQQVPIGGVGATGCRISSADMPFLRQKLGWLALVALIALPGAAQNSASPTPTAKVKTGVSRKKSAAKAKAPEPEPVVQQAAPVPPPPQRPYEMSPVPPQVTYDAGQLTISAPNSTLA